MRALNHDEFADGIEVLDPSLLAFLEEIEQEEVEQETVWSKIVGAIMLATVLILFLALLIGPILLSAQILQWFATGVWAPFDVAQFFAWMAWDEPRFSQAQLQEMWHHLRRAETGATMFLLSLMVLLGISRVLQRDR